jgi:hypothetical protein
VSSGGAGGVDESLLEASEYPNLLMRVKIFRIVDCVALSPMWMEFSLKILTTLYTRSQLQRQKQKKTETVIKHRYNFNNIYLIERPA